MTSAFAPDQRTAPLHLWRAASALLDTLFMLFGGPEKLAAQHTLTAAAHKRVSDWLRTAEALLRKLIFIEASHALPACSQPPSGKRRPATRQRKLMSFDADKPDTWRASFRCICPDRRQEPNRQTFAHDAPNSAARAAPRRFLSAWPLAERLEALIRAHNDPAPYAKRLARRLRAAPRLLTTMLREPLGYFDRIPPDTICALRDLCHLRAPIFDTT